MSKLYREIRNVRTFGLGLEGKLGEGVVNGVVALDVNLSLERKLGEGVVNGVALDVDSSASELCGFSILIIILKAMLEISILIITYFIIMSLSSR